MSVELAGTAPTAALPLVDQKTNVSSTQKRTWTRDEIAEQVSLSKESSLVKLLSRESFSGGRGEERERATPVPLAVVP